MGGGSFVFVARRGLVFPSKGVTGNFYRAYLFSKSANSIFKILIDCPFWRDYFENHFFKVFNDDHEKCNKISTGN